MKKYVYLGIAILVVSVTIFLVQTGKYGTVLSKSDPQTGGREVSRPTETSKPEGVSDRDWNDILQQHGMLADSNKNVNFYGKFIDQNGDPVSGVSVTADLFGWSPSLSEFLDGREGGSKALHTVSDGEGRFEFVDYNGSNLRITEMDKSGYSRPGFGVDRSFSYGSVMAPADSPRFHKADKEAPYVYVMWKNGDTEPLIFYQSISTYFKYGRTLYVSLKPKVSVTPNPMPPVDFVVTEAYRGKLDWELSLSVIGGDGGGFQITNDQHTKLAPADGYQNPFVFKSSDFENPQQFHTNMKVYFRNGDGSKFGTFRMRYNSDYAVILDDCYINPNGSRNLEFDRAKQIVK
jgi:hypothetical protein